MKLTEVIAIWEKLHIKDTGEIGYCDLHDAIEEVVGVENDIDCSVSSTDRDQNAVFSRMYGSRPEGLIQQIHKHKPRDQNHV